MKRWTVRPAAIAYVVAGLPLSLIGIGYALAVLYVGGMLSLTLIGLPLLALGLRGARLLGQAHARLIRAALGEPIDVPGPQQSGPGVLSWIRSGLSDVTAWRSMLYLVLRLPVDVLVFGSTVALPVLGVWAVVWTLIAQPGWWPGIGTVLAALVVLALVPSAIGATMTLHRLLARTLLGPSDSQKRLRTLERARGTALAEGTRTLRQIERDLHDGAQAQLVALAMTLSLAADALDGDQAPSSDRPRVLVSRARTQTDAAIAELRRLIDGISPAALDQGLVGALPQLTAQAAVPVTLTVDIGERPDEVIERVAYFCVAELLTNVAKHSGATQASVEARSAGNRLSIRIHDNGSGGARIGAGSGLLGLRERLAAVDGTLSVDSPAAGSTMAVVELPVRI
ncbi:sensor domain-containing protein [Kitasatospora sp. NPDC004669]|uniref:sensor histidine kinase n=1 Tax=Kitasatospora sp. NPDC004669 TaxID=3154555 RepID=UPI0033AA873C